MRFIDYFFDQFIESFGDTDPYESSKKVSIREEDFINLTTEE